MLAQISKGKITRTFISSYCDLSLFLIENENYSFEKKLYKVMKISEEHR